MDSRLKAALKAHWANAGSDGGKARARKYTKRQLSDMAKRAWKKRKNGGR